MTIGPYGRSALSTRLAVENFRGLRGDLSSLQAQLATGKIASSHAGLGDQVRESVSGRTRLATLDVFKTNIADGELRLSLIGNSLDAIEKAAANVRKSIDLPFASELSGGPLGQMSAKEALETTLEVLNTDVRGRFLFSGRAADVQPAASASLILDGDGGRAGLRTLIAERSEADIGADGRGRLTTGASGTTARVAEESANLPFGLKVAGASATGGRIAATTVAVSPASAAFDVAAQPEIGDAVSLVLRQPDGLEQTLTLKAGAGGPGEPTFAIGASAADTAVNLASAISALLGEVGKTTLPAASAMKAAADFFAGTTGNPPARVAGPPFASATSLVAGTAANTVIWYAGDEAVPARDTSVVRTGATLGVAVGASANEPSFQRALAALGAMAAASFPASDATAAGRYAALGERVKGALTAGDSGSAIGELAADFGEARRALGAAKDRVGAQRAQAEDVLAGVENASDEEVAMKLLATQTRLQASYQVTASMSRMTLVDYLR
jgi:flagellin-like hook-associated protein FlgL